jgi:hypothetical protein
VKLALDLSAKSVIAKGETLGTSDSLADLVDQFVVLWALDALSVDELPSVWAGHSLADRVLELVVLLAFGDDTLSLDVVEEEVLLASDLSALSRNLGESLLTGLFVTSGGGSDGSDWASWGFLEANLGGVDSLKFVTSLARSSDALRKGESMVLVTNNLLANSGDVEFRSNITFLVNTWSGDELLSALAVESDAFLGISYFSLLADLLAFSIDGHVASGWTGNSDTDTTRIVLEVLFAVSFASESRDEGLVGRWANLADASVLSVNSDEGLVSWAFGELAFSVVELFIGDSANSGDALVENSDLLLGASDLLTGSVDELETCGTSLGDASLSLEVEDLWVGALTDAVVINDLESWLARGNLALLSVPVRSLAASVDANSSWDLLGGWTVNLFALVILLDETILTLNFEALSGVEDESLVAGHSLAVSSDNLEVLWTVDLEAGVFFEDLSFWAGDGLALVLLVNDLQSETSWTLDVDTGSFLEVLVSSANEAWDFLLLVAFVSDLLVTVRASDGEWDDLSDALVVYEFESEWASVDHLSVNSGALESLLGPSGWAVLDTLDVLVVSETSWALVGLGDNSHVFVVFGPFVFLSGAVLGSLLGEVLPLWVVLDDVNDTELVPFSVLLDESFVPSEISDLVGMSPRSLGGSPLSDVLVLSDSSDSRPGLSISVLLVELDVSNLLGSRPLVMSKNPLDVSSVLSILVILDEVRMLGSNILVLVDGIEFTNGSLPVSDTPLPSVVDSDLHDDNLPLLDVHLSESDDSVSLVVLDESVALSDSHISVGLETSSLDDSDSSDLSVDHLGSVPNSGSGPSVSLAVVLVAVLVLVSVDIRVSPSSDDDPFLLSLDDLVSHLASPFLSVVSLDSELLLDDLDLGSGSVGSLDDNLNWSTDDSGFLPFGRRWVVVGLDDLDGVLSDDKSVSGKLSDWSVHGLDDDVFKSVTSVNSLDVGVLVGNSHLSLASMELMSLDDIVLDVHSLDDVMSVVGGGLGNSLLDDLVVLYDDLVMTMGNVLLVLDLVVGVSNLFSDNLLFTIALFVSVTVARVAGAAAWARTWTAWPRTWLPSTGLVTSAWRRRTRVVAWRAWRASLSSSDNLVGVGSLPRSLSRASVSRWLVRTSLGNFLASLDFLNMSVLGRWKSAKLSSSTLVDTLTGKDEFSHGSVGHHGVDHALEFLG